jgi:hypothetical protein
MKVVGLALAAALLAGCSQPSASPTPAASNVPCGPSEVLTRHEHAHLTIVLRGQLRTVPAFVGITATHICWLHTHDTSGIIHIEAGDARTFTLGDFFAVWGQPLSATTIDGERVGPGETIKATVNGQDVALPPNEIVLKDKEDIVLELGPPFVQVAPFVWPPGY